ncbi:hypothetical protein BDN72DRAFT_862517 [Pluteus cervinus]|uniref:Uncharacterized protein n=1 Tax=Pluteus cervinus TaxID=181527 RepID=A0ACD3AAZ1_9AGAR|nr:hypothetical protein BDN72DRAFT_862517 [Pluteus cervinus]
MDVPQVALLESESKLRAKIAGLQEKLEKFPDDSDEFEYWDKSNKDQLPGLSAETEEIKAEILEIKQEIQTTQAENVVLRQKLTKANEFIRQERERLGRQMQDKGETLPGVDSDGVASSIEEMNEKFKAVQVNADDPKYILGPHARLPRRNRTQSIPLRLNAMYHIFKAWGSPQFAYVVNVYSVNNGRIYPTKHVGSMLGGVETDPSSAYPVGFPHGFPTVSPSYYPIAIPSACLSAFTTHAPTIPVTPAPADPAPTPTLPIPAQVDPAPAVPKDDVKSAQSKWRSLEGEDAKMAIVSCNLFLGNTVESREENIVLH